MTDEDIGTLGLNQMLVVVEIWCLEVGTEFCVYEITRGIEM
jgi:hypothetical protein